MPLTNIVRDSIVEDAELPLRMTAHSMCFRAEAGSYGRGVRGMIRQHQFEKVELVSIARPHESDAEHQRMTRGAEVVLEKLGLPYRRMLLCSGDMGFSVFFVFWTTFRTFSQYRFIIMPNYITLIICNLHFDR